MSYKWGINGNDIEWSMLEGANFFILELERAILDGEAELDEEGYVTEEFHMAVSDSNPTWVYYGDKEIDPQEFLSSGKHITEVTDWAIVHHTNDNGIDLLGAVSDDYLTEEYRRDRDEHEGEDSNSKDIEGEKG